MKIYLSEFEILEKYDRGNLCDEYVKRFVNYCELNGIEIVRSNVFTDYEEINREIENSDAVVAFVDDWWLSSSWKVHEVMHPFRKGKNVKPECKVVLFLVHKEVPPVLMGIRNELNCVNSYEELENFVTSQQIA